MPFLQDIVGQAENQIKNTVTGQVNSVKNAVGVIENNLKNTVANTSANAISGGIKAVTGAASSAINAALQGNLSGVVSSLNPANIASSALSGLGIGSVTSVSVVDPGYSAAFSSSGGVNPGDALNGALARPDPLLDFLWYCQLPVVGPSAGSSGAAPGVTNSSNSLSGIVSNILGSSPLASAMGGAQFSASSSQLPWYYVEEATLPFRQVQLTSIFRDGRERHYPSKYTVGNLRLSMYGDLGNNSLQYIQAWNNAVLQPYTASDLSLAGGWGRAADYKRPIYVYLLDPTKSVLAIIEYVECWPIGVTDYSMVSATSGRIVHHVDFSVGDVFINLMNVPADLTQALVNNPLSNLAISGINSGISTLSSTLNSFL